MSLYGAFSPSVLGMMSHAHAMGTISTNIANQTTGGYKGTDTRFATVLSDSLYEQSDLGGVTTHDYARIDQQGWIEASSSNFDLAISGQGFFILARDFNDTSNVVYGRDGAFRMRTVNDVSVTADDGSTITVQDGYLVDKNGYYVLGLEPDANGEFQASGTLTPLRVDTYAFSDQFEATTTLAFDANLPADATVGDLHTYTTSIVDDAGDQQPLVLNFTKTASNTWNLTTDSSLASLTIGGAVETGDQYQVVVNGNAVTYTTQATDTTLDDVRTGLINAINGDSVVSSHATAAAGAAAGAITLTAVSTGSAIRVTASATDNVGGANTATLANNATTLSFNPTGDISTPSSIALALNFASGSTAAITMDSTGMSQFAGDFLPLTDTRNGFAASNMSGFRFDERGHVIGQFEDTSFRTLYRIPLAVFNNPNGLAAKNGNVYEVSENSGDPTTVLAGSGSHALFQPFARELSNVDMADEFTNMIVTQQAYNSSATVFKTLDEMTATARDLKR